MLMSTAVDERGENITKFGYVSEITKAVNESTKTSVNSSFLFLVGVVGFEPTTPYTPCRCPAGLGHTPTLSNYNTHDPGAGESQRTEVGGQRSGDSLGVEQMTPQMMLVRLKE